jgi:hypothetical protein
MSIVMRTGPVGESPMRATRSYEKLNHRLQLAKQDAALEPVAGPRRIGVRRAKPLEIRERHRRATLGQQALSAEFAFEKDHV